MSFDNVIHLDSLELEADGEGLYGGRWKQISSGLGSLRLGFNLSELDPGKFSCPYHYHHAAEELFLVLAGCATLRQNDEFRHVGPSDLILSKLGPEFAHQFYNHTDAPFRFLSLSNHAQWDLCEYPDSGKLNVMGQGRVFKLESQVDYWVGEKDPSPAWPKDVLAGRLPGS